MLDEFAYQFASGMAWGAMVMTVAYVAYMNIARARR